MLYARSIGFKYVVAFAVECQDPEDIEDSTKDPDVWITRKIEQLDTSSPRSHPHGLLRKFKVSNRLRHRSHVPDVYSALSREYEGDRRNVPYDQAAASIRFYNTSATMLSPSSSPLPLQCCHRGHLASHAAGNTQYPKDEKSHKAVFTETMAVLREADGILLPIRCDNVLYPAVKAKNRVRFRVHLQISSISGTRIVKRDLPPH
jgi:hypothetical protein